MFPRINRHVRPLRVLAALSTVALTVVFQAVTPTTEAHADTCLVTTGGLCAVPPPVPVGVDTQSTVPGVVSVGRTGVVACPQMASGNSTAACGGGGQASSLNCSTAVQETPRNGTVDANSQTTCNEDATLSFTYGWDNEQIQVGPVSLASGHQYQIGETYSGPVTNCHGWVVGVYAQDSAGNTMNYGASVASCFN